MTRVAVVTGAARGIGAAICWQFRRDGWEVLGLDVAPTGRGDWVQADCSDPCAAHAALERITRVDALVNNAAVQHGWSLRDTTLEQWDRVLRVNLRGPFVMTQACAQKLIEAKGAIVNVASVHAVATSENVAPYAASKAGLLGFTRAAALELAPEVRVNAVVPGAVDSDALRAGFARRVDDDPETSLVDRTPLRRIGRPDEIARAVAFLADRDRSGFVTGQALTVDGGVLARLASE